MTKYYNILAGILTEHGDSISKEAAEKITNEFARLEVECDALKDKLEEIVQWANAYPVSVFPEPDFTKARELLEAGGMTLDAVSASNMRHVLRGILEIIEGGE